MAFAANQALTDIHMLFNHLKFAFRNMLRSRSFSAINICGLVISLTAFMLMAIYIEYEFSYDKYNTHADNIYRVVNDKQANGLTQHSAGSAIPVATALLADFPQIKQAARIIPTQSLVKYQDKLFEERNMFYADASLFKIFNFDLINGNITDALSEPMSVVLTATTATKYFGNTNPIGKTLLLDGRGMNVTGIIRDVPSNSHFTFDFLISMPTAQLKGSGDDWLFTNWYSENGYTYILLPDNYDVNRLASQLPSFSQRHIKTNRGTINNYSLEKLTDIYLHSDRENQVGKNGNIKTLYIFSAIALFILLIACVNFINLSTARAAERAKEVAIKKVNGVSRQQLILQFFIESFLMTAIALVIGLFLAYALLPAFDAFSGKNLAFDLFTPVHLCSLFIILTATGLLSGCYPAITLSAFNPVKALKGDIKSSFRSIFVRKGLVVFQFSISIILIISTIVVYSQLRFMQQHDLGFKPSQTMVINFNSDNDVSSSYAVIKKELMRIPGVKSITASSNVPGDLNSGGWSMDFIKKTGDTVHTELPVYLTDFNFLNQYHIPMVAGRAFSINYAADTVESMLINETALTKLGFNNAEEAIGVKVAMYPSNARIIGVYRDFHFESLQKAIQPLAMRVIPNKFSLFSIEIETHNIQQTVNRIANAWKDLAPQRPLEYTFLDENFNKQYQSEVKFGQLFSVFSALAITIACFGLFGLALFSVKQRTKEIGIRKVIGASVPQIARLLSGDFILLVLIAIVVASPIAWYAMSKWIEPFAYRIQINWWMFAVSGAIATVIALATVSYLAIKAAVINPIKSLRSE